MTHNKTAARSAIAVALAGALGSTAALAADYNGSTSVSVSTGFTVTETTALDMGGVALVPSTGVVTSADTTTHVTVTMAPATGVLTSDTTGMVLVIADGTPLDLAVSGAAPSTALTLTASAVSLSSFGQSDISLGTFTPDIATTTDAAGDLNAKFGATMTFYHGSTYGDGTYSGNYTVSLTY